MNKATILSVFLLLFTAIAYAQPTIPSAKKPTIALVLERGKIVENRRAVNTPTSIADWNRREFESDLSDNLRELLQQTGGFTVITHQSERPDYSWDDFIFFYKYELTLDDNDSLVHSGLLIEFVIVESNNRDIHLGSGDAYNDVPAAPGTHRMLRDVIERVIGFDGIARQLDFVSMTDFQRIIAGRPQEYDNRGTLENDLELTISNRITEVSRSESDDVRRQLEDIQQRLLDALRGKIEIGANGQARLTMDLYGQVEAAIRASGLEGRMADRISIVLRNEIACRVTKLQKPDYLVVVCPNLDNLANAPNNGVIFELERYWKFPSIGPFEGVILLGQAGKELLMSRNITAADDPRIRVIHIEPNEITASSPVLIKPEGSVDEVIRLMIYGPEIATLNKPLIIVTSIP